MERHFDNHTLTFTFQTPVPDELRQKLALLVEEFTGSHFDDSFESYSLNVNQDTDELYLYGTEQFVFTDKRPQG